MQFSYPQKKPEKSHLIKTSSPFPHQWNYTGGNISAQAVKVWQPSKQMKSRMPQWKLLGNFIGLLCVFSITHNEVTKLKKLGKHIKCQKK